MKKKAIIPILLAIIIIIMIIAVLVFPRVIGKKPFAELRAEEKPFADLRAEDITNVTVQLLPPNKTVEVADYTEFVNTLNDVVIYGKDDSYKEYSGQAVIYTITVNGGKEITVNAYNPFIIIDGIGYKTKYEPCEKLSQIANELAK